MIVYLSSILSPLAPFAEQIYHLDVADEKLFLLISSDFFDSFPDDVSISERSHDVLHNHQCDTAL
jgi:hypothetical protein